MGAKMGRPTDNPKTEHIKIRATKNDKEKLLKCCEVLKTTQSDVIIKGINMVYDEIKKEQ